MEHNVSLANRNRKTSKNAQWLATNWTALSVICVQLDKSKTFMSRGQISTTVMMAASVIRSQLDTFNTYPWD